MDDRIYTVLMAGGAGTRFWPLSRRRRPKQVLPIAGDDPMIRVTVDRLGDLVTPSRLLTSTRRRIRGCPAPCQNGSVR